MIALLVAMLQSLPAPATDLPKPHVTIIATETIVFEGKVPQVFTETIIKETEAE